MIMSPIHGGVFPAGFRDSKDDMPVSSQKNLIVNKESSSNVPLRAHNQWRRIRAKDPWPWDLKNSSANHLQPRKNYIG